MTLNWPILVRKSHSPGFERPSSRPLIMRLAVALLCVPLVPAFAAAQFVIQENLIQINDETIMQQIFGRRGSSRDVENRAEEALDLQLDFVEQAAALTPAQRAKLLLAGQGDIHRFFDDVQSVIGKGGERRLTPQEWQNLHQSLTPLKSRFNHGLHGQGSLLSKTVAATLSPEQLAAYQQLLHEQEVRRYRAVVKMTIALIEPQLPLTSQQRTKLEERILSQPNPTIAGISDQYQVYGVLYRISTIPDDELRPIFDEKEWKAFQVVQQRGRSMKEMLRQMEGANW